MTKIVKHRRFGRAGIQAINYGRALRTLRAWRSVSLRTLADASGWTDTSISQWENGITLIPIHARLDICQALHFDPRILDQLASGPRALDELVLLWDGEDNDFVIKYTIKQAAEYTKVNKATLYRHIRTGLIKSYREGRYTYLTKKQLQQIEVLKRTATARGNRRRKKCQEPVLLENENSASQNL